MSAAVSIQWTADQIALVTLDMPGSSANVLTSTMFAELDRTFRELAEVSDLAGVVLLSAKPRIFVAGADLKAIQASLDWPDEKIIEFCKQGRAVMRQLSTLPGVTVAAIHGACVGGGLELTLWCDYRIAAIQGTRLGLPEVKLGLVPGWAGTVRLPRIAGLETGLDLVTSGRLVDGPTAHQLGFVDQVVSAEDLTDAALQRIRDLLGTGEQQRRREACRGPVGDCGQTTELSTQFERRIEANRQAIYPEAPRRILRHMIDTCAADHEEASASEARVMAQVWGSPPNRGLLNLYFLEEHNRKRPGFVDSALVKQARQPESIGIVGGGVMGTGIARSCLDARFSVTMVEPDAEARKRAIQVLGTPPEGVDLKITGDLAELSESDLVIETATESLEVKQDVFEGLSQTVAPTALLATNTSALPLSTLASFVAEPARFCGIHFCHPQLMELVEVVRGETTAEDTAARATAWVRRLGKTPVVVKDSPSFVVNRLLTIFLDRAINRVLQGNSFEQVDRAMRDFGFLAGPFEVIDLIGADVCLLAGRAVWNAGILDLTPSPILPRMVKQGWLGRKTGAGFYRYEADGQMLGPNPEVLRWVETYQTTDPNDPTDPNERLVSEILSAMADEASRMVDEQIVADPRDIDLCMIKGLGFPKHEGGLLFWAERHGAFERT